VMRVEDWAELHPSKVMPIKVIAPVLGVFA
jgi:hypothetical protein